MTIHVETRLHPGRFDMNMDPKGKRMEWDCYWHVRDAERLFPIRGGAGWHNVSHAPTGTCLAHHSGCDLETAIATVEQVLDYLSETPEAAELLRSTDPMVIKSRPNNCPIKQALHRICRPGGTLEPA